MAKRLPRNPIVRDYAIRLRKHPLWTAFRWDLHKQMWGILAETGWKHKFEAIEKMGLGISPEFMCFACDASSKLYFHRGCMHVCLCPLNWGKRGDPPCVEGLIKEWAEADSPEERKRLAALIRDLPLAPYARDIYTIIE